MKSMTKSAMAFCFAALLALGASACSDEGTTGPTGSEEANLSSNDGSSSPSSEGTSDAGSSKTVSSSSLSSSSSWTFPQGGGRALCTGWMFDMWNNITGNGSMYNYDSRYDDPASAIVVAFHEEDSASYPVGQGWTDSSDWTCPYDLVESPEGSGNWVTPCYWGWNDADMVAENSFKVTVQLKKFADGTDHVYGGLVYILDGWTFLDAKPVRFYELGVEVKGVEGERMVVYAIDTGSCVVESWTDSTGARHSAMSKCYERALRYSFVATGEWQRVYVYARDFSLREGATNEFDPNNVLAIGVAYEYEASAEGEACAMCPASLDLEWRSLQVN